MKAISTCHEIWHPGSHMILESVFSERKCLEADIQLHAEDWGFTDVEYANGCFALPAGAVLCTDWAQSYTHCFAIWE